MEGEEKEDSCSCSAGLLYDEGDRCPICLNCLLEQEVGFPENCSHIFCMTCILKWAEIMALCPIDRKPFQAVCKFESLKDCIKVQVRQLREKEENENCCCNTGKCCHINIKGFKRKDGQLEKGPLIAKLCKDVEKKHSDISTDDRKKTVSVKMDKPRRQTCSSEHFRNHFYSKIPSSIRTGESFSGYRSDCTELTEINAMIRQKRQEIELLWSSARARVESIPFMSCEAEAEIETFLLASTSIPGTVFPTNSRPLENFESSGKGYAVAHTQGGEEKKQASGTSGTRGTRKKPTNTTPRRRSARNSKNEAMSQSRSSPRSSNSRCSAPDDDDSSLKVSPAAPEEKPLPKRKSKRGVKQQVPVVKKKLRSSVRTEKSSSDSVEDDEAAESDTPPVLDQDHQSDNESLLHKNNAETESANGLGSCSEYVENEEMAKDYAQEQDILEDADLGSCTQEPPALQEESQKVEIKSGDENVADFENEDVCENTFEMVNTMNSPRNELLEHSVTLKKIDQTFSPQDELLENTETLTEAYQPLDSPREKLLEYPESVENDDKSFDSPRNKLSEPTASVDLDGYVDKEKKSSGKSATVQNSPVQDALTDVLITTIQDVNKLDQSFKEESMPVNEEVRIAESSKIITEQSNTHFNEDNNEIIPMECDSFCSDQAESHIEQSSSLDCVKPVETNSLSQETENCTLLSDKKGESSLHETECPTEFKKDKKTRTRRSRFHSPSTTWSPSRKGGRKSESPSPKRETVKEDVQNYYSRRGRNSSSPQSGWMRQEEETSEQDPNLKDQTNQQGEGSQLPINMMQQQMNVMPQVNAQHQPMNIFPYPVSVPPPMMNIQHNPFNIRPPIPLHLHAGVPLIQVAPPTSVTQGLPPPPPPPPPSQQVNYITSQQDGKQLQGMPNALHVSNNMTVPVLPAPTAALGNVETVQGPTSGNATSSSHIKNSNAAVKVGESKGSITVEASADSSKKDQKLLIQEKAAQEVKLAIKPFYQNKDISKEEYKEIVRKAVDKVCHSKSGEVNSTKVANLVKAHKRSCLEDKMPLAITL
ncbi:protein SCAF11 [Alligator mississippiensis]|uniref:Protein SCAF11 n=1 Tax=Alligator mississippiensis TaxID=8496 RepID=A0A151PF54_ALLMI|nr:protein SCAF11 [Alligator mississippiensis]